MQIGHFVHYTFNQAKHVRTQVLYLLIRLVGCWNGSTWYKGAI